MVNTKTKFPRGILDQVISLRAHDGECERALGPGLKYQATSAKLQAPSIKLSNQPVQSPSDKHPSQSNKRQAASFKHQASSFRTNLFNRQATSIPARVTSVKLQAGSNKLPDPRTMVHGYWRSFRGQRTKGLCKDKSIAWMFHVERNLMWRKSEFVTFSYL